MPALDLVRNHFSGAAMSHGALTTHSHQDIAAAFNELGGYSNSGEGGEARYRNDCPERPGDRSGTHAAPSAAPTPTS